MSINQQSIAEVRIISETNCLRWFLLRTNVLFANIKKIMRSDRFLFECRSSDFRLKASREKSSFVIMGIFLFIPSIFSFSYGNIALQTMLSASFILADCYAAENFFNLSILRSSLISGLTDDSISNAVSDNSFVTSNSFSCKK